MTPGYCLKTASLICNKMYTSLCGDEPHTVKRSILKKLCILSMQVNACCQQITG